MIRLSAGMIIATVILIVGAAGFAVIALWLAGRRAK